MEFKKITISDKEWLTKLFIDSGFQGSEYSFANNYNWSVVYKIGVARVNDFAILSSGKNNSFLYPAGRGDVKPVIDALLEHCKDNGLKFMMHGVSEESKALLEVLYPGKFEFVFDRDNCDYIYTREKLSTLKGKKLHSKRNHINYFMETFENWKYEEITPDNIDHVKEMNIQWCKIHNCIIDPELKAEACAVKSAFDNFFALDMKGGFITDGERIVGFTMASAINNNTIDVHIEKAFSDVRGAYPMINKQFALNSCDGFTYLNREEDTGSEGLRKAKLSYKPDILLSKYLVYEK